MLYGWNPHPWFHLAFLKEEAEYLRLLRRLRCKLFLIIGGNHPLDQWAAQFWPADAVTYSCAASPFQQDRRHYYNLLGDFIVAVKLPLSHTRAIDRLFEGTKNIDELNPDTILTLFQERTSASLSLEQNHHKAQRIRRKFQRFFGT